jgi:hypothetical protein
MWLDYQFALDMPKRLENLSGHRLKRSAHLNSFGFCGIEES